MRTRLNSQQMERGRRSPSPEGRAWKVVIPKTIGRKREALRTEPPKGRARLIWPWNILALVGFLACCTVILYLFYMRIVRQLDLVDGTKGEKHDIHIPRSLKEVREIQHTLSLLVDVNYPLVVSSFAALYLFKQAFSLPGSVFLNIIAGLVLGVTFGWPLVCILSASGATLAYTVSWLVAEELVQNVGPHSTGRVAKALHKLQERTERLKTEPVTFLMFLISLRLFPGSPNWLLNALLPHCGVPIHLFFVSIFLGLMPYNFVTVSAGNVLASVDSTADIFDYALIAKLSGAAVLIAGFAPALKAIQRRYGVSTSVE